MAPAVVRQAEAAEAMSAAYTPGDIGLVSDYSGQGDLIGNLIFSGEESRYGHAFATHSFGIVSADGDIVEAEKQGVERNHISKYPPANLKIVHFDVPAGDPRRAFAVRYWEAQVGESYGVVGFVSLAFDLLFGLRTSLHIEREPICSELASRGAESMTDHGWPYSPPLMMPDDIGVAMGILPGGEPLPLWRRWALLLKALYWGLAPWKSGIRSR